MKTIIKNLAKELNKDKNYYYGWQSNIAMAFIDEYAKYIILNPVIGSSDINEIANNAAKNFLNNFIK